MKNLKLITTHKDYLLLVDDNFKTIDFKTEDIVFERERQDVMNFHKTMSSSFVDKIIAHLPLNNAPILEGVLFLPDFCLDRVCSNSECGSKFRWKEGERITATQCINCFSPLELPKQEEDDLIDEYTSFLGRQLKLAEINLIDWFNSRKTASKKYSEEDIRKAVLFGVGIGTPISVFTQSEFSAVDNFIQSLSPVTLPIDFIPEYEDENPYDSRSGTGKHKEGEPIPFRIIKIDKGEILQGKYIYK